MNPAEVLSLLKEHGIELHMEGSSLRYQCKATPFPAWLKAEAKRHKPAIIAFLRALPGGGPGNGEVPIQEQSPSYPLGTSPSPSPPPMPAMPPRPEPEPPPVPVPLVEMPAPPSEPEPGPPPGPEPFDDLPLKDWGPDNGPLALEYATPHGPITFTADPAEYERLAGAGEAVFSPGELIRLCRGARQAKDINAFKESLGILVEAKRVFSGARITDILPLEQAAPEVDPLPLVEMPTLEASYPAAVLPMEPEPAVHPGRGAGPSGEPRLVEPEPAPSSMGAGEPSVELAAPEVLPAELPQAPEVERRPDASGRPLALEVEPAAGPKPLVAGDGAVPGLALDRAAAVPGHGMEATPAPGPVMELAITMEPGKPREGKAEVEPIIWPPNSGGSFNKTNKNIGWALFSWNPIFGCLHGCPYCYAREIALGMQCKQCQEFKPHLHEDRLWWPGNSKPDLRKPGGRRVFTGSMADFCSPGVNPAWVRAVIEAMRRWPQWTYLILSKNPKGFLDYEWPDNAWLGTTVDSQARANLAASIMPKVKAGKRFVSCEPLLERVEFKSLDWCDWILVGAQSGGASRPPFQPEASWVESLIGQAREVGAGVFLKDNLARNRLPGGVRIQNESRLAAYEREPALTHARTPEATPEPGPVPSPKMEGGAPVRVPPGGEGRESAQGPEATKDQGRGRGDKTIQHHANQLPLMI